ncbi:MAG TPA: zinc-ribbon domain-containing protein [Kofleriaceae bacterium]|nr:zinc-ribbon domain-containing protein [Kofleriaceae bacterium]
MDVRCEKCQTEYELDESRLKPGGVTVKCTNCGHMFKIRKRANTNVGLAGSSAQANPVDNRRSPSGKQPTVRADSVAEAPVKIADLPSGPTSAGERQWQVRLENGETKTCRELVALQQWIVAGIATRESLISRTGKTWKRLGDIDELAQYFVIADEARSQRSVKPTPKPPAPAATMLGVGRPGGVDEEEGRATGNYRARPPTPPPPAAPKPSTAPSAIAQTELAPTSQPSMAQKRPPTNPPPAPRVKPPSDAGRQTAMWANNEVKASDSMAAMPQGPRGGKLSAAPEEQAFAGRVRMEVNSSPFVAGGGVRVDDDDDDVYPAAKGSKVGMWIALISLLVIGAAAGAVYMLVFRNNKTQVAQPTVKDAAVAVATPDATSVVVTPIDAQEVAVSPLDTARAELVAGVWVRMQKAFDDLNGKDDPPTLALRARLMLALAQGKQDRAGYVEKAESDKLRKEAKQLVVDNAPMAQRAQGAAADNASANLAMADVMRLQGKPAPSVKRYIETARSKAAGDKELMASVALADAQLALRDGKLPDAEKALAGIEAPDDMRIKLARAQIWYAQNKKAEAKGQVDQVLATQPDNDVALAMYKKLETSVANTDPMPGEDGSSATKPPTNNGNGATKPPNGGGGGTSGGGGGNDYDSVLAKANKQAETNCTKAMDLYGKALEQRPNGVEALTGMGYCHLDAKQFSSAFSKFRAALAVSSKYEPALGGVAETYQRQGNKEAAVEAWRKYLDAYPNSAKAKKQLEILGAGESPEQPKEQPKEQPQPKDQPAPPPPPPAPGSAG